MDLACRKLTDLGSHHTLSTLLEAFAVRHIRRYILMGLLVCWGALANAQQIEDLGKLDLAVIQQRAEAGDADAQAELGDRYWSSRGVAFNAAQADSWLRKAAEQGSVRGMVKLAVRFASSDITQSTDWYRNAAEKGNERGELYLATAYERGHGLCQDQAQALFWYRKAAEQGDSAAKAALTRLDPQNAAVVSSQKTPGPCTLDRGTLLQRGSRGDVSARTQLDADFAKTVQQLQEKAGRGDGDAQAELGAELMHGSFANVPPDIPQAIAWWRTGAAHGNQASESYLGWAYESGTGVPQNLAQALLLYRKSGSDLEAERLTVQHPELVSASPTAAASFASSTNGVDPKSQEIADKIEELQTDIEQHQTAAQNWSNTAQNLAGSGCSGTGAALCQGIGQVGVADALANRNREINAANEDRAEIRRLQGQAAQLRPQLDASFSGNLRQVTSEATTGFTGISTNPQSLAVQNQPVTTPQMEPGGIRHGCWNGKSGAASGHIPGSENWSACPGY
jgi:TPR repeat protein